MTTDRGAPPSLFLHEHPDTAYSPRQYAVLAALLLLGAAVRFWGLGAVGLHGDEETMAMPALHILEEGVPVLPSGMTYLRGLGQLYLMALSVGLFGVSEWAWRLPSALTGTLGVGVAFLLGRHFLAPRWNLAYVAAIALYPPLIVMSQTARMYIFLVVTLMLFALAVLRWSRSGSWAAFAAALGVLALAIHFHTLAVFGAFLFFYPALLAPSRRALLQGAAGFFLSYGVFTLIRDWTGAPYGLRLRDTLSEPAAQTASAFELAVSGQPWAVGALAALAAALVLAIWLQNRTRPAAVVGLLFAASAAAAFFLHYYAAGLLFAAGAVAYARHRCGPVLVPAALGLVLAALFALHLGTLHASGQFTPLKEVLRPLAGRPSPYLLYYPLWKDFPLALPLYAAAAAWGAGRLAAGHRLPRHFLLFLLGVGAPVLAVGMFTWWAPSRYLVQLVPFFILCCLGAGATLSGSLRPKLPPTFRKAAAALPVLVVLLFVSPFELAATVPPRYGKFPDHKGAAEFLRAHPLQPGDLILAEDVLQQTYYLGRVDYWLLGVDVAKHFVRPPDEEGLMRDIYTATPLMGTGEELRALLHRPDRGDVYVVTNGEHYPDKSLQFGNGIAEALAEAEPLELYRGRDGKTFVWKFPAPAPSR